MILLIDNYDSFVHNLARYFERLGQETKVIRNDAIDVAGVRQLAPQAIVLSPGPCTPAEAGCSLDVVRQLHTELPLLGICLGHQTIAAALGAKIVRARTPMHGRTSVVEHQETKSLSQNPSGGIQRPEKSAQSNDFGTCSKLFLGIPPTFTVCRYHSLVVERDSLGGDLRVSASAEDGTVMAIEHTEHPVFGLQFHPEAILTEYGFELLRNFLAIAGLPDLPTGPSLAATELRPSTFLPPQLPEQPVTF